jgi:hypothetical protein
MDGSSIGWRSILSLYFTKKLRGEYTGKTYEIVRHSRKALRECSKNHPAIAKMLSGTISLKEMVERIQTEDEPEGVVAGKIFKQWLAEQSAADLNKTQLTLVRKIHVLAQQMLDEVAEAKTAA